MSPLVVVITLLAKPDRGVRPRMSGRPACLLLCLYYLISVKPRKVVAVYFTDRGIEELGERRGEERVTLGWLAARLQAFVDLHPDFGGPVGRFAAWLARVEEDDEP
jgi:hypothetical protein